MKIKDITEGLYDTLAGANTFRKRSANKPGAETQAFKSAMAQVPEPAAPQATQDTAGPSEFIKQFKIVDDNPITIQWKNQAFQRKDGTGQWVNFPGGKPVSQQMVAALDRVSPLPSKEPAKTPMHGGVQVISVKDDAGVIWTKDEDNNRWLNDAGTVADPAHVAGLEKRALTQYQARQMGR